MTANLQDDVYQNILALRTPTLSAFNLRCHDNLLAVLKKLFLGEEGGVFIMFRYRQTPIHLQITAVSCKTRRAVLIHSNYRRILSSI